MSTELTTPLLKEAVTGRWIAQRFANFAESSQGIKGMAAQIMKMHPKEGWSRRPTTSERKGILAAIPAMRKHQDTVRKITAPMRTLSKKGNYAAEALEALRILGCR